MRLSENELEIMELLWRNDRAMSRIEIIDASVNKGWQTSSFHIIINSLIRKGAVTIDGYVSDSDRHGRTYAPAISHNQYLREQFTAPFSCIAAAWIEDDGVDVDELKSLMGQIQKRIDELSGK